MRCTGRGAAATIVRTALLGVLLASAGLAAVAVVGASTTRVTETPARYGWTWDVAILDLDQQAAEALAETDVVDAVAVGVVNQAITLDSGDAVAGMAITRVAGSLDPTIIAGRAPVGDDEVALGADTLEELGDPNELVALDAEGEPRAFTVVGTTVIPSLAAAEPLAALGLLAVGHALWRTVRARRQHLAILQAEGFDRSQVRRSLAWQAVAITILGVAAGIPVGLLAGRGLWALLADELGVADDPVVPLLVVAIAVVRIGLAVLAGTAFGGLAGRRSPAVSLQTE